MLRLAKYHLEGHSKCIQMYACSNQSSNNGCHNCWHWQKCPRFQEQLRQPSRFLPRMILAKCARCTVDGMASPSLWTPYIHQIQGTSACSLPGSISPHLAEVRWLDFQLGSEDVSTRCLKICLLQLFIFCTVLASALAGLARFAGAKRGGLVLLLVNSSKFQAISQWFFVTEPELWRRENRDPGNWWGLCFSWGCKVQIVSTLFSDQSGALFAMWPLQV